MKDAKYYIKILEKYFLNNYTEIDIFLYHTYKKKIYKYSNDENWNQNSELISDLNNILTLIELEKSKK